MSELPLEIVHEILAWLDVDSVHDLTVFKNLSLACKQFCEIVQPAIFSTIYLGSTTLDFAQQAEQVQLLAQGKSPALRFAKTLVIDYNPSTWSLKGVLGPHGDLDPNAAEENRQKDIIVTELPNALMAFKEVKKVVWNISRTKAPLEPSITQLRLAELATLEELAINGPIQILDTTFRNLKNLRRLSLSNANIKHMDRKAFLQVIKQSPALTCLEIGSSFLGTTFSLCAVLKEADRAGVTLNLETLRLHTAYPWQAIACTSHLHHLQHLSFLNTGNVGSDTLPLLWQALIQENVRLRTFAIDIGILSGVAEYLASYSGLESFELGSGKIVARLAGTWEAAITRVVEATANHHSASIVRLHIQKIDHLCFPLSTPHLADLFSQFQALKQLHISFHPSERWLNSWYSGWLPLNASYYFWTQDPASPDRLEYFDQAFQSIIHTCSATYPDLELLDIRMPTSDSESPAKTWQFPQHRYTKRSLARIEAAISSSKFIDTAIAKYTIPPEARDRHRFAVRITDSVYSCARPSDPDDRDIFRFRLQKSLRLLEAER